MRDRRHGPDVAFRTPTRPEPDALPWPELPGPHPLPPPPPPPAHDNPTSSPLEEEDNLGDAEALLDTDEIPPSRDFHDIPPPSTLPTGWSLSFRHSSWQKIREKVYAGMLIAGLPPARLHRFADCGSRAWVEAKRLLPLRPPPGSPDPYGQARIRANCCRDRFCIPCAATRARILARQLMALLNGQPARFITLTRRSDDTPLADQIDALYQAYRNLRATRLWQRTVDAAAAMLEITRNKATGRWHPHLHVLASGRFIPHTELRQAWTQASHGSFIVDIRMIRDHAKAATYVSKYISKPMVASYASTPNAVAEALFALRHRRMVLLTGQWSHLTAEEAVPDDLWEPVGTLTDLVDAANAGDDAARSILACIWKDGQWERRLPPRSPPLADCSPTAQTAVPF